MVLGIQSILMVNLFSREALSLIEDVSQVIS